jgi:hypothetical protein
VSARTPRYATPPCCAARSPPPPDPLYRPGLGRLALFAARSYVSLTARIPALRRKFLADLSKYRDDLAD